MAVTPLASTTFLTGPNDALETVDVYAGDAGVVINAIASLAAAFDVDAVGLLRASSTAAQAVPTTETVANSDTLASTTSATARTTTAANAVTTTTAAASTVNTAFNTLSTTVQTALTAAATTVGDVTTAVNGIVSTITNGGISDVQSLGAIINAFSGSTTFTVSDAQALAGIVAGVINQCAAYGISGAFAPMVSNITSTAVLSSVIAQTLSTLIKSGDLVSLQALVTQASSAGVSAINPSALSDFTSGYSRSASGNAQQATPSQGATTWASVLAFFAGADPTWNVSTRTSVGADDNATDITTLQDGSDDFKSVLAAGVMNSTDPAVQLYALAAVYPVADVDTDLKAFYPNAYIDPALRMTPKYVEPDQLSSASAVSAATSTSQITAVATTTTTSTAKQHDRVGDQPTPGTYIDENSADASTQTSTMISFAEAL
ncbi:hypothetical protein [Paraburkholderia sp. BCC1886]|uniref:hypothetical protein n=1 Tax=Paraburkholderia sp. BCC1886 TaxID=2562670 RepID=UPI0011826A6D|nr:hypothetical protein [Paraburkholderia sp. BCC1886]